MTGTSRRAAAETWMRRALAVAAGSDPAAADVPVGAVVTRPKVMDCVFDGMERCVVHSNTFGQNDLAMAAGLALIPLAMAAGESGSEIQTPMAIVILCGLLTSTALNMFVVPALYLRFGSKAPADGRNQKAESRKQKWEAGHEAN